MITLYEVLSADGDISTPLVLIASLGVIAFVLLCFGVVLWVYLLGKQHARENREELRREIKNDTLEVVEMLYQKKRFKKR